MLYAITHWTAEAQTWDADAPRILGAQAGALVVAPCSDAATRPHGFALVQKVRHARSGDVLHLRPLLQPAEFLLVNGRPVTDGAEVTLTDNNRVVFGSLAAATGAKAPRNPADWPAVEQLEFDLTVGRKLDTAVKAALGALLLLLAAGLIWSSARIRGYNDWVRQAADWGRQDSVRLAYVGLDSARAVKAELGFWRHVLNADEKTARDLNARFKERMYRGGLSGQCPDALNPEYRRYVGQTAADSLLFDFLCQHEQNLAAMTDLSLDKTEFNLMAKFREIKSQLPVERLKREYRVAEKGEAYNFSNQIEMYADRAERLESFIKRRAELNPGLRTPGERLNLLEQIIRDAFKHSSDGTFVAQDRPDDFLGLFETLLGRIVDTDELSERESRQVFEIQSLIDHYQSNPL